MKHILFLIVFNTQIFFIQAQIFPGFKPSGYFNEQQMVIENSPPGTRILINAPLKGFGKDNEVLLIFYALPNGNTIEQTFGKKLKTGDDWHFDIQHIGAQTRFLRKVLKDQTVVVVYLETVQKSWPQWVAATAASVEKIKEIVDNVSALFGQWNPQLVLNGHSGGGRFIFSYINAVEISKGAVCAGNVFVNCELGIHILNSCDVKMYQNTLVNSTACISRSERSAVGDRFEWHPATGPDVDKRDGHVFVNNLMTGDARFNRPLLFVWQRNILCEKLTKPQFKQIDYNVYVQSTGKKTLPMILWSPAMNDTCIIGLDSPADLHKLHPEFSAHSTLYSDYSVFKSNDLGNYQLIPAFPGARVGSPLPAEISLLLKRPKKDVPYTGAYPLVQ